MDAPHTGEPTHTGGNRLERHASMWESACVAFVASGLVLLALAIALVLAPELSSYVPTAVALVAALSFVAGYGSWRACLSCERRCREWRGRS